MKNTAIVILRLRPADKAALAKIKKQTGESINSQVQKAVGRWIATSRKIPVVAAALLIGSTAAAAQERTVVSPDGKGRIVAQGPALSPPEAAGILAPGSMRPAFFP